MATHFQDFFYSALERSLCWATFFFIACQRCSIGFKSGEITGHVICVIRGLQTICAPGREKMMTDCTILNGKYANVLGIKNHIKLTDLARWHCAESYWKMAAEVCPYWSSIAGRIKFDITSPYFCVFIIPSTKSKGHRLWWKSIPRPFDFQDA